MEKKMKEITFEDIKKANALITTTNIKGKEYAEVNQRIKAFRSVFPQGFVKTEISSIDEGMCIITATVGFYDEGWKPILLGTGTAYEKESSSFINKTSYIENCETSAVGRALGMAGFGIDTSIASAEEVSNAILNQVPKDLPKIKKGAYMDDDKLRELLELAESIGWDEKRLVMSVRTRFGKNVTELNVDEYTAVVNGLCRVIADGKQNNK